MLMPPPAPPPSAASSSTVAAPSTSESGGSGGGGGRGGIALHLSARQQMMLLKKEAKEAGHTVDGHPEEAPWGSAGSGDGHIDLRVERVTAQNSSKFVVEWSRFEAKSKSWISDVSASLMGRGEIRVLRRTAPGGDSKLPGLDDDDEAMPTDADDAAAAGTTSAESGVQPPMEVEPHQQQHGGGGARQKLEITLPAEVVPGQRLMVPFNGMHFSFSVPPNCVGGQRIVISISTAMGVPIVPSVPIAGAVVQHTSNALPLALAQTVAERAAGEC